MKKLSEKLKKEFLLNSEDLKWAFSITTNEEILSNRLSDVNLGKLRVHITETKSLFEKKEAIIYLTIEV